ncbi:MAG: hypothetical protein HY320_03840 [Armatimonadetes bacterium]|nr:hypothetical protein [Armatimonadota bacterium]
MIQSFCRCLALALLLASSACAAPECPYTEGKVLCRLQSPLIQESSGLVASSRSDDYFFTHNDSGDGPNLYAVNRKGEVLATLRVTGAAHLDWEDMARGPDEKGKPALYLGDIGDNLGFRPVVSVYRIPEPVIDATRIGISAATAPALRFDLQYEDGAHDAETLLVHPRTGQVFIVTKARKSSAVYVAPTPLRAGRINRLRKVAEVNFGPFPPVAGSQRHADDNFLVTGGDISPDGKRVVVRTYANAYEWKVEQDDMAGAFRRQPVRIPLPAVSGGEAIAYSRNGRSLLTSSEGLNTPVYELLRR